MHDERCDLLAPALVAWQGIHGRHDLPWQRERTPYRVWVSEIMLQQTQVSTVIGYFERFMLRFPDVRSLADAPIDDVLHLWSGLGYYARARNLHRAAQQIRDQHDGAFPLAIEDVIALPGIGRSTAGAILAISSLQRHAILDGNVKRVLARVFAIEGSPAARATELQLWQLAERCTPTAQVDTYTQAIMDLGATVCTLRNPACTVCPAVSLCEAARTGRQGELPAPKAPRSARAPRRRDQCVMLLAVDPAGRVLLQQRPTRGIWGGLWSLPQFDDEGAARVAAMQWLRRPQPDDSLLTTIEHSFTHFDLAIQPLRVRCAGPAAAREGAPAEIWFDPGEPARVGLPAPIKVLLESLDR